MDPAARLCSFKPIWIHGSALQSSGAGSCGPDSLPPEKTLYLMWHHLLQPLDSLHTTHDGGSRPGHLPYPPFSGREPGEV